MKTTRARVRALRQRRTQLANWIDSLPFQRCPVAGSVSVSDNFGDIRDMPGTPRHIHQGIDIGAPTGAPIVAPFDGDAVAVLERSRRHAGKIYGAGGYVYNAHLSAYGKLGSVRTGDVVGYVGIDRQRHRATRPLRVAPGRRRGGRRLHVPRGGLLRNARKAWRGSRGAVVPLATPRRRPSG